ncbi:MAG: protein-S-isoprenylcysteine O-methyltransferase [Bacteroidota bacterium]
MSTFEVIYLMGWVGAEIIRFPHRQRNKSDRWHHRLAESRIGGREYVFDITAFFGTQILPLFCIFSTWLDFAAYRLPAAAGWFGALLLAGCVAVLWRAHAELGFNWSSSIELQQEHTLVTRGVYSRLRHPIYAALWLWCIAQPLLIQNWIGGFAGLVTFVPLYFTRVPSEERMMLDRFGDEYRDYMNRTGRVLPRL